MTFLYTVRYGATAGNCGGDLHLFFSTQNAQDWNQAQKMWIPSGLVGTTKLVSGDSIAIALNLVANLPGELYPQGTITVTTAAGQSFPPGPMGQATANFLPGQPVMTVWQGRKQGSANRLSWDIGFTLPVPWDGTSADCHGQWWAIWH